MKSVDEMEMAILTKLVGDALAQGYTVSVNDGGDDDVVVKSTDAAKIIEATRSTSDDLIIFYKGDKRIGWVSLVYGNDGYDVMSDYTVNAAMKTLIAGADALANEFQS